MRRGKYMEGGDSDDAPYNAALRIGAQVVHRPSLRVNPRFRTVPVKSSGIVSVGYTLEQQLESWLNLHKSALVKLFLMALLLLLPLYCARRFAAY